METSLDNFINDPMPHLLSYTTQWEQMISMTLHLYQSLRKKNLYLEKLYLANLFYLPMKPSLEDT